MDAFKQNYPQGSLMAQLRDQAAERGSVGGISSANSNLSNNRNNERIPAPPRQHMRVEDSPAKSVKSVFSYGQMPAAARNGNYHQQFADPSH